HTSFSRDWSSDVCSSDLCLTVTDNQLTLTTSNWDHRVNRFDTCLQWLRYRLTVDNTRRFTLDRHFVGFTCYRSFTINRLTQCIRSEERRVGKECCGGWCQ